MTDSKTLQVALSILRKQEAKGEKKYGANLDDFSGSVVELIDHAIEEAADQLCYLVKMRAIVGGAEDHAKDNDGWIEHDGLDVCPVDLDEIVDVRLIAGDVGIGITARSWRWGKSIGRLGDITHYRVHKP